MPLIDCPDCGGKISNKSWSCPRCGLPSAKSEAQKVTVSDIDMSFRTMVSFMVKWAFAMIPAAIVIVLIGVAVSAALGGMFAGLRH